MTRAKAAKKKTPRKAKRKPRKPKGYQFKFDKKKYYYDEKAGERVVKFVEQFCSHVKGPLRGEALILLGFWKEILHESFGIKKKSDGFRKNQFIYIEIPKKNAKSLIVSAVGLYLLCADGEKGGEIFAAAGDKEQARQVFDACKDMVEFSPFLSDRLTVLKDSIYHKKSGSVLKVTSAEANTKHGPNLNGILFDELHVQPNSELYDTLTKGIAARDQPMIWLITTAGVKNTFAYERHQYAKSLKENKFDDPRWMVRIWGADPECDIRDPKVWQEVNPAFDQTVKRSYFEGEIIEINNSPSRANAFKQLHLNIWTGSTVSWLSAALWDACNKSEIDVEKLKGQMCYGGLDLASTRDLNAFSLIFPPNEIYDFVTWLVWFWVPEDTVAERDKKENVMYSHWCNKGWIKTTPGNITDYNFIEKFILEAHDKYDIQSLGYDRYRADQTIINLTNEGLELSPVAMTASHMNAPIEELEKLIIKEKLNHGGNKVLGWQSENLVIKENHQGEKYPDKARSKDKIDGMVSGLIALYEKMAIERSGKNKKSKYETEEIASI